MSSAALQLADDLETLPLATSAKRQQCVLLIEDNEDSMFLVKYALQEYGEGAFHLNWANCLSTGLEQLLNGGVDIVLLDLGLPESSGPESYAWVREVAPKTPVVVLTGDSRDQTELAILASGVEGYLVKDEVSGSHLLEVIRAALLKKNNLQKLFNFRMRIL
jgi:DNA-binding NarL/FixJ family response regulator